MEKSSETQDEKSELCFTSTGGKGNCFLPSSVFQWLTYLLFSIVKFCDNVDWFLLFHSGQPYRLPVLQITLQTLGYTHDFHEDEASVCFFSLCQLFFKKSSKLCITYPLSHLLSILGHSQLRDLNMTQGLPNSVVNYLSGIDKAQQV